MRKIPRPSQTELNKKRVFSGEEWGKIPLKLKQRWWAETNFSTLEPSPELMATMRRVIETGREDV